MIAGCGTNDQSVSSGSISASPGLVSLLMAFVSYYQGLSCDNTLDVPVVPIDGTEQSRAAIQPYESPRAVRSPWRGR